MERKTMGSLIAALRKTKGMTQRDLAERLNVSDKSVSRWERDEGAPDLSLIPVIAEIFGITCDELLRGECYSEEEIRKEVSHKGEKEFKRLLQKKLTTYQITSIIGYGIMAAGFFTSFLCKFISAKGSIAFLRAVCSI